MILVHKEYPDGVVTSVAGQIGNSISHEFTKYAKAYEAGGIRILGTSGEDIDNAENRMKFGKIMDELGINQPRWAELRELKEAKEFAEEIGYPVLVRPSYVLSGAAMRVADNEQELTDFLQLAAVVSNKNPVVITKFYLDAREIECDGVSDEKTVFIAGVVEHIENAGVHSGRCYHVSSSPQLTIQNVGKDPTNHETNCACDECSWSI